MVCKSKNSATPCKFGKDLTNILQDKFITGMKNGPVKYRLCEEEPTRELNQIVEIAMPKEVTIKLNVSMKVHKVNKWISSKGNTKKYAVESGQQRNDKDLPVFKGPGKKRARYQRIKEVLHMWVW